MNIYINRDCEDYIDFETELSPIDNHIGSTWEDYLNGYWVLLSNELIEFHKSHPEADFYQVINMSLEKPINIEDLRSSKLEELKNYYENSVQGFYISKQNTDFLALINLNEIDIYRNANYQDNTLVGTPGIILIDSTGTMKFEVPVNWLMDRIRNINKHCINNYLIYQIEKLNIQKLTKKLLLNYNADKFNPNPTYVL